MLQNLVTGEEDDGNKIKDYIGQIASVLVDRTVTYVLVLVLLILNGDSAMLDVLFIIFFVCNTFALHMPLSLVVPHAMLLSNAAWTTSCGA